MLRSSLGVTSARRALPLHRTVLASRVSCTTRSASSAAAGASSVHNQQCSTSAGGVDLKKKATIRCDLMTASSNLAVFKLHGYGKDFSGMKVSLKHATASGASTHKGVVVLQRFPLIFVCGEFNPLATAMGENASAVSSVEVTSEGLSTLALPHAILQQQKRPNASPLTLQDVLPSCGEPLTAGSSSLPVPLFQHCPDVSQITQITRPLHTGVTAIDVLTPIGRGQNMLFAGGDVRFSSPSADASAAGASNEGVGALFRAIVRNSGGSGRPFKCVVVSGGEGHGVTGSTADTVAFRDHCTSPAVDEPPTAPIADGAIAPSTLAAVDAAARYWLLANAACSVGSYFRSPAFAAMAGGAGKPSAARAATMATAPPAAAEAASVPSQHNSPASSSSPLPSEATAGSSRPQTAPDAPQAQAHAHDSVVILDFDLGRLELLWRYSSLCLRQFVHNRTDGDSGASAAGASADALDEAGSNSEKRKFYASVFQQVGQMNGALGGGSMTILCRADRYSSWGASSSASTAAHVPVEQQQEAAEIVYRLEDFTLVGSARAAAATGASKPSAPLQLYNAKTIARLEALLKSKPDIKLTAAVLKKIGIPPPFTVTEPSTEVGNRESTAGSSGHSSTAPAPDNLHFIQEITSLTDGHVFLEPWAGATAAAPAASSSTTKFNSTLHFPAVSPAKSLSRVGANNGTRLTAARRDSEKTCGEGAAGPQDGKKDSGILHFVQAIQSITQNHTRFDLAQVDDLLPFDASVYAQKERVRALAWLCAMEQPRVPPTEGASMGAESILPLPLFAQVVHLLAAQGGFYDAVVREHAAELTADGAAVDWVAVKRTLFAASSQDAAARSRINRINDALVLHCNEQLPPSCVLEINTTGKLSEESRAVIDAEIAHFFDKELWK